MAHQAVNLLSHVFLNVINATQEYITTNGKPRRRFSFHKIIMDSFAFEPSNLAIKIVFGNCTRSQEA